MGKKQKTECSYGGDGSAVSAGLASAEKRPSSTAWAVPKDGDGGEARRLWAIDPDADPDNACDAVVARPETRSDPAPGAASLDESLLRDVFEAIQDRIVVLDPALRIVGVNKAMADLHPNRPLVGRRCHEALHSDPHVCSHCPAIETLRTGVRQTRVVALARENFRMEWVEFSAFPLRDATGNVTGAIELTRDVTERKQTEESLARSERLYRTLARNYPAGGVFLFDRDLRFVVAEGAGLSDLHLSTLPLEGHTVEETLAPALRRSIEPFFTAVFDGKQNVVEVEFDDRALLCHTLPIRNDAGRVYAGMALVQDITERKREEEERQRLEARMRHAQKLESLGVLAGGIAHDFNNLLVAILGNAGLALLELPRNSPARVAIREVETASRRASDLCRQMLAYSGKGNLVIEPIDLSKLVQEMASLLEVSISKNAVLRCRFAEYLPPVHGDATQLRQVVMNLITNACDSLQGKPGAISIGTGFANVNRDYLEKTYMDKDLEEGYYAYVEVSDTGCGMDETTKARVFDPFFTTKHTGRGLGLAAVLGIVRSHKGVIRVYSEVGRGTTFKILLPCSKGFRVPTESENVHEVAEDVMPKLDATILVVDDEEGVRSFAKRTLERAGLTVLSASNGLEAVEIFKERSHEIRAVLLDLAMPHMDGEEAFRHIRAIRGDVPVVLSSGYNEQDATARFAGKGLSGFLHKPYQPGELLGFVQRIVV